MLNTKIKESDWRNFGDIETKPYTPYWFKMENGNVVLAIWIQTKYSSGWAEAFFDNDFTLKYKTNTFYMLRGAKLQCALANES